MYPGILRPNLVEYISIEMTDFLQAGGDIAACSVISAALRYGLRECVGEQVCSLRPKVGQVLTLTRALTNIPSKALIYL